MLNISCPQWQGCGREHTGCTVLPSHNSALRVYSWTRFRPRLRIGSLAPGQLSHLWSPDKTSHVTHPDEHVSSCGGGGRTSGHVLREFFGSGRAHLLPASWTVGKGGGPGLEGLEGKGGWGCPRPPANSQQVPIWVTPKQIHGWWLVFGHMCPFLPQHFISLNSIHLLASSVKFLFTPIFHYNIFIVKNFKQYRSWLRKNENFPFSFSLSNSTSVPRSNCGQQFYMYLPYFFYVHTTHHTKRPATQHTHTL